METKLVKPDGFVKPSVPAETPRNAAIPKSSSTPPEQLSAKTAASRGEQNVQAGKLFMNVAANLGLPKDALSAALLVFARFFSLSADKALIGSLRREILELLKSSTPGTAEEKAALEAKAMAAVVAADKGINLAPAALERYARFLMPASFMPQFMTKATEGKDAPSHKTAATSQDRGEKSSGVSRGEAGDDSLEEMPEAEELRAIARAQMGEDGFLDLLNYLPGKNGQYWLVFPFNINVKGVELKVLLRVLQSERGSVPGSLPAPENGQLIADISGPKRQWRCFVNNNAGKFRADIRVYPEYPQRALDQLRKQAEKFLGKGGGFPGLKNSGNLGGFEEIIVRNGDRIPLWADDLWPDHLPFIDEEV
jgi:hypothetical protein